MPNGSAAIVQKLWNYCDVLRDLVRHAQPGVAVLAELPEKAPGLPRLRSIRLGSWQAGQVKTRATGPSENGPGLPRPAEAGSG